MRENTFWLLTCFLFWSGIACFSQPCAQFVLNEVVADSLLLTNGQASLVSHTKNLDSLIQSNCPLNYEQRIDNLNRSSRTLLSQGLFDKSFELYGVAAQIAKENRDTILELKFLAYQGNALLFKGDFRASLLVLNDGYGRLLSSRKILIDIWKTFIPG